MFKKYITKHSGFCEKKLNLHEEKLKCETDEDLYKEFKKDWQKRKYLVGYIVKYNKKEWFCVYVLSKYMIEY